MRSLRSYSTEMPQQIRSIPVPALAKGQLCSLAVPFSWEHSPGIPKVTPPIACPTSPFLLPPPVRIAISRKKHLDEADDPFAVALLECAKESQSTEFEELFMRAGGLQKKQTTVRTSSRRRGLFNGFCDLCDISTATTIPTRQPGKFDYGFLNGRAY